MTVDNYDPHRSLMRVLARAMHNTESVSRARRSEFVTAAWKTTPMPERARMLADLAENCAPSAVLDDQYAQQLHQRAHTRKTGAGPYEVDPARLPSLDEQLNAALELVAARRRPVEL